MNCRSARRRSFFANTLAKAGRLVAIPVVVPFYCPSEYAGEQILEALKGHAGASVPKDQRTRIPEIWRIQKAKITKQIPMLMFTPARMLTPRRSCLHVKSLAPAGL